MKRLYIVIFAMLFVVNLFAQSKDYQVKTVKTTAAVDSFNIIGTATDTSDVYDLWYQNGYDFYTIDWAHDSVDVDVEVQTAGRERTTHFSSWQTVQSFTLTGDGVLYRDQLTDSTGYNKKIRFIMTGGTDNKKGSTADPLPSTIRIELRKYQLNRR